MEQIAVVLPKTIKENLQLPDPALVQIYRDRENRTIWMLDEVDDEVFDWIDFILDVNREDETNQVPVNQRKPIKCLISNWGGDANYANTLVDIISISRTPVYGYAIGMCASAASMIYLACQKRFALPSTTFLFHQGSAELKGNCGDLMAFMEDYQKDIIKLTAFYKTHTTFAPEVIEEKLKRDWYIRVPEALENGIVHQVIDDINLML